jgi:glutathione synthase/RimK-type ligase-like ATP-grasp enzyme
MSTYIHYSGATDVTGPVLVERLGVRGGTNAPSFTGRNACTVYIGWGCKTRDALSIPNGVTVLNHANMVKRNRNKLEALGVLRAANVSVADFLACERRRQGERVTNVDALHALGYPLVGRTKYHQGGKGFWPILDRKMLEQSCADGAGYVQRRIEIADEYRLHVFDGNVIYAAKKVAQENPQQSWTVAMKEKIVAKARAENVRMNNNLIDVALAVLSVDHTRPDMLVRSNTRGWKFSRLQLRNVNAAMSGPAIAAVSALGLTFGAVDMATNADNDPFVIEVNSAPGLERSTLDAWVNTLQTYLADLARPAARQQGSAARGRGAAERADRGDDQQWLDDLANNAQPEEAAAIRRLLGRMG